MPLPTLPCAPAPVPSTPAPPFVPRIRLYQDWLQATRGLRFDGYDALWHWSVTDLDAFWQSIWDHAGLQSPTPHTAVLADDRMPGAVWFPGAQVNYTRQVLRHVAAAEAHGMPAVVSDDEQGRVRELSWPELRRQVASLALTLRGLGVVPGDRVAAYLPNVPEAIVCLLACAALGAVWSVCAPDMGTSAVADRFVQIGPKVLIAVDGVFYAGRAMDRSATVEALHAALPTVEHLLVLETPFATKRVAGGRPLAPATALDDAETDAFEPAWLPFDHPLWIVYSSGTTGLPKPIVHGHGGILLTLHAVGLHNDVGASYDPNHWGERFHWYSSTGWVMWNTQVAGLVGGTTACIFDGNPGGPKDAPDWSTLWRFAARHRVTFFGAGAAFYSQCMKAGVVLRDCGDLAHVRALGSTGSPLSEDVQRWGSAQMAQVYAAAAEAGASAAPLSEGRRARPPEAAGPPPARGSAQTRSAEPGGVPEVWWCNISGGTDFAGAFVGGHRELPQVPGQMQCRQIGHAVEAWDAQGRPVKDAVGELVCTRPIPSMPLCFWNDAGHARYLSSYFDTYPGIWRHGDWIRIGSDGGCTIYGRSDATINRHGLRMGTSEIYRAVEALPEVLDSMVVDLEYLGRDSWMPLFVVLREGLVLDDALQQKIAVAIRAALSPRFVPDAVYQVRAIPRTLTGKKQELPVKKLLLGQPPDKVVNRAAMADPDSLDWYVELAKSRT